MTYYPPDAIAWHCNICNTPVDVELKIDHLASLEHRRCAVTHSLGGLEDELTGRYVFGGLERQDYDGGGGGVSVGGGGAEGKGKGKQVTVEAVEDYDEGGYRYEESESEEENDDDDEETESEDEDEDEEEYEEGEYEEGDYQEGEEGVGGNRMLWTCEICTITINVFGREDHVRSREHLREARARADRPQTPPPSAPTWHCAICDEEMTVFHQADHVASKQHLKHLRNQTPAYDPRPATPVTFGIPGHPHSLPPNHDPITPAAIKSTAYKFRNTFYCITCAAEFDLSTQDLHLETTETWDCAICPAKIHPAAREQHLRSNKHLAATAPSQSTTELFYCIVCSRTYPLASRAEHLAGESHRASSVVRSLVTEMPMNPGAHTWLRTTEAPMRMTPGPVTQDICYVCKEPLYNELLSSHLVWHCTKTSSSITAPRPSQTAPPRNNSITPAAGPKPKPKGKGKGKKQSNAPPGSIYCYICHIHVPRTEMTVHRATKKHIKKAAKIAAKIAARAAKKAAKATATATATTAKPKPKPKQKPINNLDITAASTPYITVSGESFHCKVCGRNRMVAGMTGHVKSNKHKKNLAAALAGNAPGGTPAPAVVAPTPPASREGKLPQLAAQTPTEPASYRGYYYCNVCKIYTLTTLLASHMSSKQHLQKVVV